MIIDGRAIASGIEKRLQEAISHLKGRPPTLAFVQVGEHPASTAYVRMKRKKCHEVGIISVDKVLASSVSQKELMSTLFALNDDPEVDGILVQLPLPSHIETTRIIEAIAPHKDVDGFHPINVGKMLIGEKDGFLPCTPYGVQVLLSQSGIDPAGQHVVILGRSNIVGKPLAALLMQKREGANATVTIAHSQTKHLKSLCQTADILVAAMGQPHFVKDSMVKEGAVVIDVGISRAQDESGHFVLTGDVDFEKVAPKCSYITPVPGGVGPMTIAMLLSNTLLSYQRRFS